LVVDKKSIPDIIKITSYSKDDDEIMSLEVDGYDIYGVQFHPESIMSEHGYKILDNFLKIKS
jgi:anthranilate synthase component 2